MKSRKCINLLLLAVIVVGNVYSEVEVDKVIKNLKHKDPKIRSSVAKELSKTGKNRKVIENLIECGRTEKDANVRTVIYQTLGGIADESAVEFLIDKVNTETNIYSRETAILSLGKTQSPQAIPILREIFLNEEEIFTARIQAANALTCIPYEESVKVLGLGLKSKNPQIRIISIHSLSSYVSDIMFKERIEMIKSMKSDPDDDVRNFADKLLKEKYNLE